MNTVRTAKYCAFFWLYLRYFSGKETTSTERVSASKNWTKQTKFFRDLLRMASLARIAGLFTMQEWPACKFLVTGRSAIIRYLAKTIKFNLILTAVHCSKYCNNYLVIIVLQFHVFPGARRVHAFHVHRVQIRVLLRMQSTIPPRSQVSILTSLVWFFCSRQFALKVVA